MTTPAEFPNLSAAKSLLGEAVSILASASEDGAAQLKWDGREPKASIDLRLNDFLTSGLRHTGIPILSEETDHNVDWQNGQPVWILDPLDGTLNFIRGVGPSAISLCLWQGTAPKFGVMLDIGSRELYWGGRDLGSWRAPDQWNVSKVDRLQTAVLCTGIPAGFDFRDEAAISVWVRAMAAFGKVRMVGSAASSLAMVARGSADCYFENSVKIWDVAAGIALVEGAGGCFRMEVSRGEVAVNVVASNTALEQALTEINPLSL